MKFFVLLAALAAATLAGPVSASTLVTTIEITEVETNACTGEPVVVVGEAHLVFHTNVDAAGGEHTSVHLGATDVTVTTLAGEPLDYRVVMQETFVAQLPVRAGVFTTTQEAQVLLIAPGAEPDSMLHVLLHTTFVDGEPTATVEEVRFECTGPPRDPT